MRNSTKKAFTSVLNTLVKSEITYIILLLVFSIIIMLLLIVYAPRYNSYCYLDTDNNIGISSICKNNYCSFEERKVIVKQYINVRKEIAKNEK